MSNRHRAVSFATMLMCAATTVFAQDDHSQHQSSDPHAEHRPPTQPSEHAEHQHHVPVEQPSEHVKHQHHVPRDQPTESERAHVPPEPPELVLGEMSSERMIELMQMEDDAPVGMLRIDELEGFRVDGHDGIAWDIEAWYGDDYDRVWLKSEGERIDSQTQTRAELSWDRIITPWWSLQAGVRHDLSEGPSRTWAAVGVQGLAPYFFEIDATLYVGEHGRTAARLAGEYELLITQRWVLQPSVELDIYGKDDVANRIGSGFSQIEAGLRLRYEVLREFAPYVGVHWERRLGQTADLARAGYEDVAETTFVAGLRVWF